MDSLRKKIRSLINEEYSNLPLGFSEDEGTPVEYTGYEIDNNGEDIYINTTNFDSLKLTFDDLIDFLLNKNLMDGLLEKYLSDHYGDLEPKSKDDVDPFDTIDR